MVVVLQFIHLRELQLGTVESHAQTFDVAEPAVLFGFGDAFFEIVDDVLEPVDLAGIRTEKGAAEACVFVLAACAVGAEFFKLTVPPGVTRLTVR